MLTYTCPVCGYDKMKRLPKDWYICPCCGTEFESDDDEMSHSQLRTLWVIRGMRWFSERNTKPENWNPIEQLKNVSKN